MTGWITIERHPMGYHVEVQTHAGVGYSTIVCWDKAYRIPFAELLFTAIRVAISNINHHRS